MNWEYIAGFFDGEGCITKSNKRFNGYQVIISQKEKHILDKIQEFLLVYDIRSAIYANKKHGTQKNFVYSLYIRGQQCVFDFLSNVFPLIYIKKEKAIKALKEAKKVIARKNAREDTLNKAIETWKQGFGYGYISALYGADARTIRNALIQRGLKPRAVGTNQYNLKKSPLPE